MTIIVRSETGMEREHHVILNQMLRKVKIEDPGDTKFLPGEVKACA